MAQNYYELLEISENATDAEIEAAFKSKAREVHPDKVAPGNAHMRKVASEAFKDLSEARATLLDAAQRRRYDAQLTGARGPRMGSSPAYSRPFYRPPAATPDPQEEAPKIAFWKPADPRFGIPVLALIGLGGLLLPGEIAGSLSTTCLGVAFILVGLALLFWRHAKRRGPEAKVLRASMGLFVGAALFLIAWIRLPSVDPKTSDAPLFHAKPARQQATTSRVSAVPRDPDEIPIDTKPGVRAKRTTTPASDPARSADSQNQALASDAPVTDAAARNSYSQPIRSTPVDNIDDRPTSYFTLGSTKDEVLAAQGTPTKTSDSEWAYGSSRVRFKNDRVISWRVSDFDPLHVKMLPSATPAAASDFFTLGSTKEEVLAVQGTPTKISDSEWSYGLSRVKFKNDRVVSWKLSEFNPLKARKVD